MRKKFLKNSDGFTLIELSISIIIIGVIAVGIIKGAGLIKSSKIISINRELTKYASATELFLAKYDEFPGIIKNAKQRLGSAAQETETASTSSNIINASGSPLDAESLNFFNHLSVADLVNEEEYVGSTTNLTKMTDITKKHYPFLKSFPDHFYYVRGDSINGSYNQVNRFAIANKKNEEGKLDADFIFMVDTKFDDGDPLNGFISIVPTALYREWDSGKTEGDGGSGE